MGASNGGSFVPTDDYNLTGTITIGGIAPTTATGTQTLTNKTLTSPTISAPVLSGSATGTYTLAGTPTITAPAISAPVLSGSATGTYTLAGTPTITAPTITSPTVTGTTSIGSGATLTAPTLTTPTMTSPTVTGDASGGMVVSKTVAFVEDATSTTFTGTVVLPAGSTLLDIVVTSSVLWSKASSRFICGDAQSANGWFVSTNLNATDLLVGERFSAADGVQAWGGLQGAYLVSATGRMGQATATASGPYYTSASSVIGVVTVTPGAGTAGRTFMTVMYSVGQSVAAVLA